MVNLEFIEFGVNLGFIGFRAYTAEARKLE